MSIDQAVAPHHDLTRRVGREHFDRLRREYRWRTRERLERGMSSAVTFVEGNPSAATADPPSAAATFPHPVAVTAVDATALAPLPRSDAGTSSTPADARRTGATASLRVAASW